MEGENVEISGAEQDFSGLSDESLGALLNDQREGAEAQDVSENLQEGESPEGEVVQESQPEPTASDEIRRLTERLEAAERLIAEQRKQVDGQETLVHRRTSDFARFRAETEAQIRELQQQLANAETSGEEARIHSRIVRAEEKLEEIKGEEQVAHLIESSRMAVQKFGPKNPDIEAAAIALKRDGALSDEQIAQFKADPFSSHSPDGLVHLLHRVEAEKNAVQWYQVAQKLKARIDELEKKSNPDQVMSKIQRTLKETPTLTSANGSTRKGKASEYVDPSKLSDEDLDRLLQEERAKAS